MENIDHQTDLTKRKERYNQFVLEVLDKRPIRGRWLELPRVMIQSLLARKGIAFAWKGFWSYRRDQHGWKSFLRRALPVMAYPIMVNSILRIPGTKPSAGLVITTFDKLPHSEILDLIRRIEQSDAPSEQDRRFLSQLLTDDSYQPNRRRPLPPSITGNKIVYACDVWIPPLLLKNNSVDIPYLPCMAEPGDKGRITVLPWWIAIGEPEPVLNAAFWQPGQIGIVASF